MMDKNTITLQEVANDGQSIFLYYDSMAGAYLAFGLSAYYVTMVTEPYLSYSEEMQMPVALLMRGHVLMLRQSTKKEDHIRHSYYHFRMRSKVGQAGYDRWAQTIWEKHNAV